MPITQAQLGAKEREVASLRAECNACHAFEIDQALRNKLHLEMDRLQALIEQSRKESRSRLSLFHKLIYSIRIWVHDSLPFPETLAPALLGVGVFCAVLLTGALGQLSTVAAVGFAMSIGGVLISTSSALLIVGVPTARAELDDDKADFGRQQLARQRLDSFLRQRHSVWMELRRLEHALGVRQKYEHACAEFQRLQDQYADRTNQLQLQQWRDLRGIAFEAYLVEVFEILGFHVQTTKGSGDQGVDLIVRKGTLRLAIQAKGYADPVGNGSVQEAFAGMAFYKCDRCIVITNSSFTRHARELAHRINCMLIDGSMLPDLIAGKIQF
jgi:HJR/Mrr/RecB family endonuclease